MSVIRSVDEQSRAAHEIELDRPIALEPLRAQGLREHGQHAVMSDAMTAADCRQQLPGEEPQRFADLPWRLVGRALACDLLVDAMVDERADELLSRGNERELT